MDVGVAHFDVAHDVEDMGVDHVLGEVVALQARAGRAADDGVHELVADQVAGVVARVAKHVRLLCVGLGTATYSGGYRPVRRLWSVSNQNQSSIVFALLNRRGHLVEDVDVRDDDRAQARLEDRLRSASRHAVELLLNVADQPAVAASSAAVDDSFLDRTDDFCHGLDVLLVELDDGSMNVVEFGELANQLDRPVPEIRGEQGHIRPGGAQAIHLPDSR